MSITVKYALIKFDKATGVIALPENRKCERDDHAFRHEHEELTPFNIKAEFCRISRNVRYLLIYPDIAAARFAIAMNALSWAYMLLIGTDAHFSGNTYEGMNSVASRFEWGVFLLALGSIQMFTLIERIRPTWHSALLAFIGMIVWVYVATSLVLTYEIEISSASTNGVIAWLSVWVFFRSRKSNEPDMRRRKGDFV